MFFLIQWIPFFIYFFANLMLITHNHLWQKYPNPGQHFTIASFFVYIIAINWLCLTPTLFYFQSADKLIHYFHGAPYNLIPLQGVSQEFFLNIVMTIPLGVYLYLANPHRSLAKAGVYGFCFSLFIECNQFICGIIFKIGRVADVDDLITNTLGTLVGFGIMILLDQTILHRLFKIFMLKKLKSDTLSN